MSTNSSGEVELVYECDTDKFHRYRGVNQHKEITVYLERFKITGTQLPHFTPPPHKIKTIVRIDDRPKESFTSELRSVSTPDRQIELLTEIRDALKRTKNNPRRSAKKRS